MSKQIKDFLKLQTVKTFMRESCKKNPFESFSKFLNSNVETNLQNSKPVSTEKNELENESVLNFYPILGHNRKKNFDSSGQRRRFFVNNQPDKRKTLNSDVATPSLRGSYGEYSRQCLRY